MVFHLDIRMVGHLVFLMDYKKVVPTVDPKDFQKVGMMDSLKDGLSASLWDMK